MATTVGHAQIEVSPELNQSALRRFEAVLRAEMNRIERTVRPEITIRLDASRYRRELQALTSRPVRQTVNLELDAARYRARLQALTRPTTQTVNAVLNAGNYRARLQTLTRPTPQRINAQLNEAGYRIRLQALTRPVIQQANLRLDDAGYRARLQTVTRPVTQQANLALNEGGYRARLAVATRAVTQHANLQLNEGGYRGRLQSLTRPVTQEANLQLNEAGYRARLRAATSTPAFQDVNLRINRASYLSRLRALTSVPMEHEVNIDYDHNLARRAGAMAANRFILGFNNLLRRRVDITYGLMATFIAVGSALAGGLLEGMAGMLIAGIGVAGVIAGAILAAAGSPLIRREAKALGQTIFNELKWHAKSEFEQPMLRSIRLVRSAWESLGPVIRRIFANLAPLVEPFTRAVLSFVRQAAIGIEKLTRVMRPFTDILFDWIGAQLPKDIQTFFDKIAQARPEAFRELLNAISLLLPILGHLIQFASQFDLQLQRLLRALVPVAEMFMALGFSILPVFISILEGLAPVFNFITRHAEIIGPLLLIAAAAVKVFSVAMAVLNATMMANPIVLIAVSIAALVAALIWAYHHFEGFRNVVETVFRAIGTAAVWLWQKILLPAFRGIATAATWLFRNILQPLWRGIVWLWQNIVAPAMTWLWQNVMQRIFRAIGAVTGWLITKVLLPGWRNLVYVWQTFVAPAVMWLWNNIIKPVFGFIGVAALWMWNNAIKPAFNGMVMLWRNIIGPVVMWLWQNVIGPAFRGIATIIKWLWNNIISPVFDFWMNSIRTHIGPAILWLWQTVVRPVFRAIGAIITWVWNTVIKPVFDLMVAFFQNIVAPVIRWLWENVFRPVFTSIGAAWRVLWTGAQIVWQLFWATLQAAWAIFLAVVTTTWTAITTVIRTLWNGLWTVARMAWQIFWTAIQVAWNIARTLAVTIWTGITTAIRTVWNALWTGARAVWNVFWTAITTAWNALRAVASAVWNGIRAVISAIWNGLWNAARTIWNGFRGFIVASWNAIRSVASTVWNGIRGLVQGIWNALWNAARSIWNGFSGFIRGAWNAFRSFASGLWNGIRNVVTTVWRAIWNTLRTLWNGFWSFIRGAWNSLRSFASGLWNAVRNVITSVWRAIWNALRTLWNGFWSFIRSVWNNLRSFANNLWNSIRDRVVSIWRALWSVARNLWNSFAGFIRGAWNNIRSFASNLWNSIRNQVANIWRSLWATVRNIWNNVSSAIRNSMSRFRDSAISLFRSAADGIRDMWARIKEFVAAPVRFVVNTVWNDGVGKLWGAAKKVFTSMPDFPRASVNFATGGIYPGYTPGRDVGVAAVSGGEAIMRPEWTRAIGAKNIHEMNRVARTKGVHGVREHLMGDYSHGHARGGVVTSALPAVNVSVLGGYADGGIIPDWVPGSGVLNDVVNTGADLAGRVVGKMFFNNPIAEKLAKSLEKGIDGIGKEGEKGILSIPRRFAVGIYDQALAKIASLAAPAVAGDGGDQGVGSNALLQAMIAFVRSVAPGARVSSGYRPGDPGYHGRQRAIDIVFSDGSQNRSASQAPAGQAARAAQAITQRFMGNTLELIWDPLKSRAIWNGRFHMMTGGSAGPGTHNDHIHWAFGGTVEQLRGGGGGGGGSSPGRSGGGSSSGSSSSGGDDPDGADFASAGVTGAAKFGSLDKATGLWEKYKEQVQSAAMFSGSNAALVNADGNVMQQAYAQAKSMGASNKVLLALFMAGFVESGFRNLNYGDRDSVGFLQQRPSSGWGSVSQIMNVPFATRSFVSRAMAIERRNPGIGAGALAQAVQISAFPGRYEQFRPQAIAALKRLDPDFKADQGGWLPKGISVVQNDTGKPEAILTHRQWAAMAALATDDQPDQPIELYATFFLDGKEIDARIETRQREHDKRLVRAVTARRRR